MIYYFSNFVLFQNLSHNDSGKAIIFLSILILFIAYQVYNNFLDAENKFGTNGSRRFKFKPEDEIILQILETHLPYYNKLKPEQRSIFRIRLCRFLKSTRFVGVMPLKVTEEMAIRVSAAFTQITFGMRKNVLDIYIVIKIHPEHYYNERTKRFHKGEVDTTGIIKLSWEDFVKGYEISDDGYNLGIHEMAHALALELFDERQTYIELMPHLRKLFMMARDEIKDPMQRSHFLRHYAYVNVQEYFAVATEAFFEAPFIMRAQHPELFEAMCNLYGQKPLEEEI